MPKRSKSKKLAAKKERHLQKIKESGCTAIEYYLWEMLLAYIVLAAPNIFPDIADAGPKVIKKLYPNLTQEELEWTTWGIKVGLFHLYMKNPKFPRAAGQKLVLEGPRPGKGATDGL